MGTTRESVYAAAQQRWPEIELDFDAFSRHLEQLGWLEEPPAQADYLYLCCACGAGDERACIQLENEFFADLRRVVARINPAADFVDETMQLTRQRLFAPPDPRVLKYTGHGQLRAFLRVTATRIAYTEGRSVQSAQRKGRVLAQFWSDAMLGELDPPPLRAEYARVFERCLRDVLGALSLRERTILRLYFVEGLNIDAIGQMYHRHRANIAKWLQRCRRQMHEDLRQRVQHALGQVTDTEFASLLRLVQDEIDLSISVLLASAPPNDAPA